MRKLEALVPLLFLAVTAAILFTGLATGAKDLTMVGNFVSEFAARPDRSGTFVCASMWGFGITYIAFATVHLRRNPQCMLTILGALCLAAAASLLPFVAEYRLWVEPVVVKQSWWKELLGIGNQPQGKPPEWVIREQVHGNAIQASMLWVLAGMTLIGLRNLRTDKRAVVVSVSLAAASLALFAACQKPVVSKVRGALELAAFLAIAGWFVYSLRFRSVAGGNSPGVPSIPSHLPAELETTRR